MRTRDGGRNSRLQRQTRARTSITQPARTPSVHTHLNVDGVDAERGLGSRGQHDLNGACQVGIAYPASNCDAVWVRDGHVNLLTGTNRHERGIHSERANAHALTGFVHGLVYLDEHDGRRRLEHSDGRVHVISTGCGGDELKVARGEVRREFQTTEIRRAPATPRDLPRRAWRRCVVAFPVVGVCVQPEQDPGLNGFHRPEGAERGRDGDARAFASAHV